MKTYKFKINGTEYNVHINNVEGQEMQLEVNGTAYNVTLDNEMEKKPATVVSRPAPRVAPAQGEVQRSSKPTGSKIQSPLPGTILDVKVSVGDKIKEGQCVAILEAMKMENAIESDAEGTVTAVNVKAGDSVLEGDILIVIE